MTPLSQNIRNRLYRKGEVPEELKGRGVWQKFGNEMLFVPFGRDPNDRESHLIGADWRCKYCGTLWYYKKVIEDYNAHCPRCGKWMGLKGLKFNGVQKGIKEFAK